MTMPVDRLQVRPALADDSPGLCALLNAIIRIGGTTAYERPLAVADFTRMFLAGPHVLACHVAVEAASGALCGFQSLEASPSLPAGWADIASFARPEPKFPGVGTALFAETARLARARGLVAINATIRADNAGGLAYYAKMGFEDYRVTEAVPLADGTPVDRISKRFLLG